jgi:iron complex outermembrane receptor protein
MRFPDFDRVAAACALGALAAGGAAQAGEMGEGVDPFALSPEQLFSATVISVSRSAESLKDAAAAVSVITAEDMRSAGATSIPEALRLAPGVEVARVRAGAWAISVRGFNGALANKLLVLIDGREVYDPLFSGVYWDVQDTAIEDIDRIEVIRGPGASLWGANAVNGVINIITKNAADTQGALLSAVAGNQERASLTARFGAARADGTMAWRVYAKAFDRRAEEDPATGRDAPDEWKATRAGFRFDATPGRDFFTLQGDVYKSDTGLLRSVPSFTPPYSTQVIDDVAAAGGNLTARWTRDFEKGARLTAQTYLDVAQREQRALNDRRTTLDLDVQYELPAARGHKLVAGAGYRSTRDAFQATPILFATDSVNREERLSAFVQDQIALAARWRLTLGSKIERNDFTGVEAQPTARVQWQDDAQTAWASASRAVRTPSELERRFSVLAGVIPPGPLPLPVSVEVRPSPRFESERLIAYEAGWRRRWGAALALDVAGFYNVYDGLATLSLAAPEMVAAPPHIVLPIDTTNATRAKSYGLEAALDWRLGERLTLLGQYAFLRLELSGPPSSAAISAEAAEGQSPRNRVTIGVRWRATDRLSLDSTAYYADSIPGFALAPHTRIDLRAGWRLTETASVDLVGQDLLEPSHREFGAPTAIDPSLVRRSVFVRLLWRR